MSRVALLSSEPLRERMAGIGIRYFEFARHLSRAGIEVVLLTPGEPAAAAALGLEAVEIRLFERGRLAPLTADCDCAVGQGQLANDLVLEAPELPLAIDLYDPWLIENLHYHARLGLDPYRNDHATWVLQLSRGDFFLCSSEEQRRFYLGFLAALGRVNPERIALDPDLSRLIAPVPFGVPDELPAYRPLLEPRRDGERRLLFGGLYDWYDPWPVLEALEALDRPQLRLLVIRNPNPESTPQQCFEAVERWSRQRGWWGGRVKALDWIPFERRYDLLREVDLLVATHRPGLETELSLRTRFLDALAAGCPVVTTAGGTVSRLLREWGAGWVVGAGDREQVAAALKQVLDEPDEVATRVRAGSERVRAYRWTEVIAPLLRFCCEPQIDETKERFVHRPETVVPRDPLRFRLRRRLRRLGGL